MPLRSTTSYKITVPQTLYAYLIGYHAVSDFNSLDKTIRASGNVNIFKRQVFNSLI